MDEKLLEVRALIERGKLDEAETLLAELREAEPDTFTEQPKDEPKDEPKEAPKETPKGESKDEPKEEPKEESKSEAKEIEDKGESRSMDGVKKINPVESKEEQEVRAFAQYVRTHEHTPELRDIKLESVEAIVPIDRITQAITLPETIANLEQYVRTVNVSTTSGSYPILESTKAVMVSVLELVENPKLAEPTFKEVDWKVQTFRGYIPISNESLQDSDMDLAALVARHITRIALNTLNQEIMKEVNAKFTAEEVTTVDQIKDVINLEIDPAYNVRLYMNQSAFAKVDKLKDADGQYIVQPNLTMGTGRTLLGKELVVLPDAIFKNDASDALVFVGDLHEAVTLFKRTEMTVRWQDHTVYGEMLAGAIRFDVEAVNTEAGKMLKLGAMVDNIASVRVVNASEFPST